MQEYIEVFESKEFDSISVQFYIEVEKPFSLGEAMAETDENAYMNGYNWDAFLQAYLNIYAPELLSDLESDPEAGTYFARYPLTDENRSKARKLKEIITDLVENKEKTLNFLTHHGKEIEWD